MTASTGSVCECMFALVDVTGPNLSMILRASGWSGMRIPTVFEPDVSMSGMLGFFVSRMVSGPGRNFRMSFLAGSFSTATLSIIFSLLTAMDRGMSNGLFFAM